MNAIDPHRQQLLYWRELGELTTAFFYYRHLRNSLRKTNQIAGITKAVATSGAIGGWLIWQQIPYIWASILALSQLLDVVKSVIPFNKNYQAASSVVASLDTILIDSQLEWEDIFSGRVSDRDIPRRCHKLMRLRTDAERKHFPAGHTPRSRLFDLAKSEARDYLSGRYGTGDKNS
jgi:hypothetical protein